MITRRQFLLATGAGWIGTRLRIPLTGGKPMYGLIGRIVAVPGRRDELATILLDGIGSMPGCLSYIVAADPEDEDGLWVTEVWSDQASHRASLSLPSVREAIARGRPLIAGFDTQVETRPLGGHGLVQAADT